MDIKHFSVFGRKLLVLAPDTTKVDYLPNDFMGSFFVGPILGCEFLGGTDVLSISRPRISQEIVIQLFVDDGERLFFEVEGFTTDEKRILVVVEKPNGLIRLTFVTDPMVIGILTGEIRDRKEIESATHKAIQAALRAMEFDRSPDTLDLLSRELYWKIL